MTHAFPDRLPDSPPVSPLGGRQAIAPDVERVRLPLSNAFLLGTPGPGPGQPWVLLDAGTPGSARMIVRAAQQRFGPDAHPQAIVLTHGHLDHIGALWALRRRWGDVPIYAHDLELPYLSGQSAYPPPDPTVGGSMSALSPLFVPGPFDFRPQLAPLAALQARIEGGDLPALSGWTFIDTPGHSPGHVSLWRARDRLLLAGDAFVTTVQETVSGALTLRPSRVHRPPAYYTPDWDQARDSVQRLAALRPALAVTGHGDPLDGERLNSQLAALAADFDSRARPARGRYVRQPALTGVQGVVSLPPLPLRSVALRVLFGVVGAALLVRAFGRSGRLVA